MIVTKKRQFIAKRRHDTADKLLKQDSGQKVGHGKLESFPRLRGEEKDEAVDEGEEATGKNDVEHVEAVSSLEN